jgi:hypothetical protein
MASVKLHEKFLRGLEERKITIEEFNKYKYAGGNRGSHRNYFKICGLLENIPAKTDKCICTHYIEEQCYLANDAGKSLIIGNCCIKYFVPEENQGRHCAKCNIKHRNRKDNYCKKCRELCKNKECFNIKKSYNIECDNCLNIKSKEKVKERVDKWKNYCEKNNITDRIIGKCFDCGKSCKLYIRCFDCNEIMRKKTFHNI